MIQPPHDNSLSSRQKILVQLMRSEQHRTAVRIPPREYSGPAPLSVAQQRLWFIGQIEAYAAPNNIPIALRITGPLDAGAIQRSLNCLVARHEALRTNFSIENSRPVQIISRSQTFELPMVDLSAMNPAMREKTIRAGARDETMRIFDLGKERLFRGYLIRAGSNEHILLLTLHHIIADGWSIGILVHELATLYNAFEAGKPSPLGDLPIQYADFAEWQHKHVQDGLLEQQLDYWRKQLADLPEAIELPMDRPRPPVRSFRSQRQAVVLPKEFRASLQEIGRRKGITSFMVLLAAFNVLLHRYTGERDIVVGTDVANRDLPETERLIGFFVNQLVLRTSISGNPTFDQLLQQVRRTCLEAYAAQDVPFNSIVEALRPSRNLQHSLMFQVKLVLQNSPVPAWKAHGLKFFLMEVDPETVNLDMFVNVLSTQEGIRISLDFNTDIFNPQTATRLLDHFRNLLIAAVHSPDRYISELPLLSQDDRKQVLTTWNQTAMLFAHDSALHELLERAATMRPDATALAAEDLQLSYGELNSRANQLGNYLKKLGVRPETVVGICLPRHVEFVVAILGVLKAGAAYLPLDPDIPAERLSFMIEDAGVAVIISDESVRESLPAYGVLFVCFGSDDSVIEAEDRQPPDVWTDPENLAYVIYTSGSTGKPKGVMVTQRSVCNLAEAQKNLFGMDAGSRVLQFASWGFDASVSELWTTILAGGCLCLISRQLFQGGPELEGAMHRQQVTTVTMPPSLLMAWKSDISTLATLVVAGEACNQEVATHWGKGRRFINAYGPTEATVCASLECAKNGESPGIGRPIGNVQLYVVDEYLEPVSVGMKGELFIGGVGVARGYIGQPALTAERFIPDTFSGNPGARLYRTGDAARYIANGSLEFIGRIDNQVKIRGYRIELGEIEATLATHPAIERGVVVVNDAEGAERRLIAYVVPRQNSLLDPLELRAFLQTKLPDYMVPAVWIELQDLPLTRSGKIDRKRLPDATHSRRLNPQRKYEPLQTAVEKLLAQTWSELLGVASIGLHDNFFDLGGHSLLGTLLVSRLTDVFAVELSLKDIFETPVLQDMAARVEKELTMSDHDFSEEGKNFSPGPDQIAEKHDQPRGPAHTLSA